MILSFGEVAMHDLYICSNRDLWPIWVSHVILKGNLDRPPKSAWFGVFWGRPSRFPTRVPSKTGPPLPLFTGPKTTPGCSRNVDKMSEPVCQKWEPQCNKWPKVKKEIKWLKYAAEKSDGQSMPRTDRQTNSIGLCYLWFELRWIRTSRVRIQRDVTHHASLLWKTFFFKQSVPCWVFIVFWSKNTALRFLTKRTLKKGTVTWHTSAPQETDLPPARRNHRAGRRALEWLALSSHCLSCYQQSFLQGNDSGRLHRLLVLFVARDSRINFRAFQNPCQLVGLSWSFCTQASPRVPADLYNEAHLPAGRISSPDNTSSSWCSIQVHYTADLLSGEVFCMDNTHTSKTASIAAIFRLQKHQSLWWNIYIA